MLIIPLEPTPSQVGSVVLAEQGCSIKVYQTFYSMFMDVYVNDILIIGGVQCLVGSRVFMKGAMRISSVVLSKYLAFTGDFTWIDIHGLERPNYKGIGTRFFLAYLEEGE